MPKQNLSLRTIPLNVGQAIQKFGRNIATARKRRGLKQADLAAKVGISTQTMQTVERGAATTSIGAYFMCAWALGLYAEIENLLAPERDEEGKALEMRLTPQRVRNKSGKLDDDF